MLITQSHTLRLFCKQHATVVALRRTMQCVHFNTPKDNRYTYFVLLCENIAKRIVLLHLLYMYDDERLVWQISSMNLYLYQAMHVIPV